MRASRSRILAAVAILGGLSATPANASQLGFYVGGFYGDASREFDVEPFDALSTAIYDFLRHTSSSRTVLSTASDGESYGFFAGYRLNQYLAFEGGYLSLGKQNYREVSSGVFVPPNSAIDPSPEQLTVSLTNKTSGFALSALAILPISYSWEVYARGGLLLASNTLSIYVGEGSSPLLVDELSESSTDLFVGAGISVSLLEVYALRAEFQRIFANGDNGFGEGDVDLISIGITVAF
jgi:hypothetical protein